MGFGVVTNDGDGIHLFISPHGVILNTEAYIKYFDEVELTWIKRVTAGRSYV